MISYFIEFAIIHILFYGIYKLLLGKETQLTFLRTYLLTVILLALVIPLVHIPSPAPISNLNLTGSVSTYILPEIAISDAGTSQSGISFSQFLIYIVIFGSLLAVARILFAFFRIRGIYLNSTSVNLYGRKVRQYDQLQNSFTFFRWIFIDTDFYENSRAVIHHEEAHVKFGHSYDLLFINLLTIPFWWLPTVWLTLFELKKIHEYQADSYALDEGTLEDYTRTLIGNTLKYQGITLANSFYDTSIKKRLSFMKQFKKNISTWKIGSMIAALAITVLIFSCEDNLGNEVANVINEDQGTQYSDQVQQKLSELTAMYPQAELKVVQVSQGEDLPDINMKSIKFLSVENIDGEKVTTLIIDEKSILTEEPIAKLQETETTEDVFTVVEEAPTFPGGIREGFYSYVAENLRYPEQARKMGIEGRVFVQFIVTDQGEVKDVVVVRGIGAGCDEQALNVIKNSPNWIAGKQKGKAVNVRMIIPITFELSE